MEYAFQKVFGVFVWVEIRILRDLPFTFVLGLNIVLYAFIGLQVHVRSADALRPGR